METQSIFASRDEIWRLQNEMKSVHVLQAEHSDRLLRLERRQDEDTRVKSVWGGTSPFPSILESGFNPAAEAFRTFDQDQSTNMMGSLHLDAEEEPRRGTSRANSVRFDESALHGHFGHASRSSSDLFPLRSGSAFGNHPMTERSSSHKSDGRHSSAGQSMQSAHLNSMGSDARMPVTPAIVNPVGPPPGLLLLGPLPSIIRCWLETTYSNETLLYAAICTGSCKSILSRRLALQLNLTKHSTQEDGEQLVKIPVYLPEATIQESPARSASPAPQLPAFTVEFAIHDLPGNGESIEVFLGSDVLRARNADILFSQDRLMMFDDDRNKLAIPLVRPENATMFRSLLTTSKGDICVPLGRQMQSVRSDSRTSRRSPGIASENASVTDGHVATSIYASTAPPVKQPSVIGEGRRSIAFQEVDQPTSSLQLKTSGIESGRTMNGATPETPTKAELSNSMWGNWRRNSTANTRAESAFSNTSSYQRAGRGKGMKILKPARSTSRSVSALQTPSNLDSPASRWPENINSREQNDVQELSPGHTPDTPRGSFSGEAKPSRARSSNPIGGASAFGWLNSSQNPRQPPTPTG